MIIACLQGNIPNGPRTMHHLPNDPLKTRRWQQARQCIAALVLAFPVMAGAATPTEAPHAIQDAARVYIAHQVAKEFPKFEIAISELDPRLALPACAVPLQTFFAPGAHVPGNAAVGVRCRSGKPWLVYVPAQVKGLRRVVVTAHPLIRGATINAEDLAMEEREINGNGDALIFDPRNVLGMVVNRPLAAATALTPDMLSAPLLVHYGQQVIIVAHGDGFEVRMAGTALGDGAQDQVVRANNTTSRRVVEGRVIAPGIIQVSM